MAPRNTPKTRKETLRPSADGFFIRLPSRLGFTFTGIRSFPFFVWIVYFAVPLGLFGAEPAPKLHHGPADPHWIGNTSRFWYRVDVPGGEEFFVVDGDKATRTPAFDPARAAAAITRPPEWL